MSYRLLRQDCLPDSWSIQVVEGIHIQTLIRGRPLDPPASPIQVSLSALGTLPSDFLESPCPIVSDRMKRALERTGLTSLQWFPAELTSSLTGSVHRRFWAMNVIGMLTCVDRLSSQAQEVEDSLQLELGPFAIDPLRTYDLSLFRLAEDPRVIMIHQRVQNALLAADLRGLLLQDPGAYDNGLPACTASRAN